MNTIEIILTTLTTTFLIGVFVYEYKKVLDWRKNQLIEIKRHLVKQEFKLNDLETQLNKLNKDRVNF